MAGVFDEQSIARIIETVRVVEREQRRLSAILPGRRNRPAPQSQPRMFIAEVDSDATGGGYYNCHLQTLDATDWDTTTADQLDDTGDSVVVLNLAEIGTAIHNLDAGDLMKCWFFNDDEGNRRLVGEEVLGRNTFGNW